MEKLHGKDGTQGVRTSGNQGRESVNYYDVLDVDVSASRVEIREAYLRLKSTYSAGSAALYSLISEDEAREQMMRVEEAFRILNDDVQRRDYDRSIGVEAPRASRGASARDRDLDAAAASLDAGLNTERLMLMREQARRAYSDASDQTSDPTVVRTTRSTLPIIKLKASKAGVSEIEQKLLGLINGSDAGDGDLYKRLREACDVGEDEMQERTKVSIGYLRAIESNRFDRLPQAVYVKGFLRSYFRYLSVPDAEKLIAAYSQRLTDWQASKKS